MVKEHWEDRVGGLELALAAYTSLLIHLMERDHERAPAYWPKLRIDLEAIADDDDGTDEKTRIMALRQLSLVLHAVEPDKDEKIGEEPSCAVCD